MCAIDDRLNPVTTSHLTDCLDRSDLPGEGSLSDGSRSEEHTSELQSRSDLVCRLLLEKKKSPEPPAGPRPRSTPFCLSTGRCACRPSGSCYRRRGRSAGRAWSASSGHVTGSNAAETGR